VDYTVILSATIDSITYAGLLFLVSSGFTLVFGLLRVLNLAHGALYIWGGYVGLVVAAATGNWWIALISSAAAVGLIGLIAERLLFRRVRGDTQGEVILTIGISFVLADLARAAFGGYPKSVTPPSYLSGTMTVLGLPYGRIRIVLLIAAVLVLAALFILLRRSRVGALVRAAVDDREMLSVMGIRVSTMYTGMFVFASVLAGFAGFAGANFLSIYPGADSEILLLALVIVVIGGLGSLSGAVIGSLVIAVAVNFGTIFAPQFVYFLVFAPMLLILVVRPTGLLGRKWD
jgi:branched-chain amino acid transport system permease protein